MECSHMATTALEEEKKEMEEMVFIPGAMKGQEVITSFRKL